MATGDSTSSSIVDVCLVGVELAVRYLRSIVQNEPDIRVFSEKELSLRRPRLEGQPLVFVIDMESVRHSLTQCLRRLRSSVPSGKVLLLAGELSSEELCGFLFLGIDGYLPYSQAAGTLRLAIESLCRGHTWIEPLVLEEFVGYSRMAASPTGRRFKSRAQQSERALTAREEVILGLLHRRLSNKEIASSMGISENTVKFHVSNIFEKLGVHNRDLLTELATGSAARPEKLSRNETGHKTVDGDTDKFVQSSLKPTS